MPHLMDPHPALHQEPGSIKVLGSVQCTSLETIMKTMNDGQEMDYAALCRPPAEDAALRFLSFRSLPIFTASYPSSVGTVPTRMTGTRTGCTVLKKGLWSWC